MCLSNHAQAITCCILFIGIKYHQLRDCCSHDRQSQECVSINWRAIAHARPPASHDRAVLLAACAGSGQALKYVDDAHRGEVEVVAAALGSGDASEEVWALCAVHHDRLLGEDRGGRGGA